MIGPISLEAKQMGARSAGNPHAALRRGGGWKRGTAEILGHSQTKGRANRGNKLRPKPARQSSTLPMSVAPCKRVELSRLSLLWLSAAEAALAFVDACAGETDAGLRRLDDALAELEL